MKFAQPRLMSLAIAAGLLLLFAPIVETCGDVTTGGITCHSTTPGVICVITTDVCKYGTTYACNGPAQFIYCSCNPNEGTFTYFSGNAPCAGGGIGGTKCDASPRTDLYYSRVFVPSPAGHWTSVSVLTWLSGSVTAAGPTAIVAAYQVPARESRQRAR